MEVRLKPVASEAEIEALCGIAERVWHLTYDSLVPKGQVEYMLEKFQSPHAVKEQMSTLNYRYYLLVCGGEIAWCPGAGAAERFRATERTKRVLIVEIEDGKG